jgi:omega-6 fatty acid desaturase (delta-12 desaturase)
MPTHHPTAEAEEESTDWKDIVRKYQRPCLRKSIWQLANTLVPFVALWVAMYYTAQISFWLTAPLALFAGAFMVRIFVIFHDCTHGSFFRSKRANEIVGFLTGVLAFTPYHHWRWEHTVHHAHAGNLDRRGMGDVWTLTVEEYLAAPFWQRIVYRLSRNPFILFVFAPLYLFLVWHRIARSDSSLRDRLWLYATNLGVLLLALPLVWLFGIKAYLLIQLTIVAVASVSGVWLFYVQHQFEDVYWERREDWDYERAALEGSSFYKLPGILQWFSANIGFHHIHHLSPRIPNYELPRAHRSEPIFQGVKPLTVRASMKSLTFRLWDESKQRLTNYQGLKSRHKSKTTAAASPVVAAAPARHADASERGYGDEMRNSGPGQKKTQLHGE